MNPERPQGNVTTEAVFRHDLVYPDCMSALRSLAVPIRVRVNVSPWPKADMRVRGGAAGEVAPAQGPGQRHRPQDVPG